MERRRCRTPARRAWNLSADLEITLVNRDDFHAIRVRNYEADLSDVRVALDAVLDPIGVRHIVGNVADIDLNRREVGITTPQGRNVLPYDRLVMAAGSEVARPPVPGLADHAFSVDTFDEATRLDRHLAGLSGTRLPADGRRCSSSARA